MLPNALQATKSKYIPLFVTRQAKLTYERSVNKTIIINLSTSHLQSSHVYLIY